MAYAVLAISAWLLWVHVLRDEVEAMEIKQRNDRTEK